MDESRSEALRRAARRARLLIDGLLVLASAFVALCLLWGLSDPHAVAELLRAQDATYRAGMADWQARSLVALLVLQTGLWGAALFALRGVFQGMQQDPPFPARAVLGARHAFRWMLAGFLFSLLTMPLAAVLGSLHMPPGQRVLSIELGSGHALTLVVLTLTAIMSRAFALAAELWQDHVEIV